MADNTTGDVERAWELMKKIGYAMLVTRDGDRLRARPMAAYVEREEDAIYFLTDARQRLGDRFSLRAFHDFVWKNGNVPIALQRWEMLGLNDELKTLDRKTVTRNSTTHPSAEP